MALTGSSLLLALAGRMTQEADRNPDPEEQAKALAMADIFRIAGEEVRSGRAGELALAVLTQAKLGAHLVDEEG